MKPDLIGDLIYLFCFLGGFCLLIAAADLILTGLSKLFPDFERKLFAMFGLDIDDFDDFEEDEEPEEPCGKIIPFDRKKGASNE